MPNTVPNQRVVAIHRETTKSDFLGIKNANWQAAARDLGAHALMLYLYLASNANNYTLALSPVAIRRAVGMPPSTYTDQFNNAGSLEAHEFETGPEIADQLDAHGSDTRRLRFVVCAGTGAHLTGITRALRRRNFDVAVTLVEPEGCDSRNGVFVNHRLEGMAVGVKPPMLDWDLVDEVRRVNEATMLDEQQRFAKRHGWMVGNTSAACLAIAADMAARRADDRKVLSIAYDHGLWYQSAT